MTRCDEHDQPVWKCIQARDGARCPACGARSDIVDNGRPTYNGASYQHIDCHEHDDGDTHLWDAADYWSCGGERS